VEDSQNDKLFLQRVVSPLTSASREIDNSIDPSQLDLVYKAFC